MQMLEPEKSEKLKYQRMPELIKDQLMDWIMDGTISMGDKLNAEDLASRMGVSRMPVREALRIMEKSGIVQSIPYVGARVVELQMTDIVQIYLMRQALEPLACYYACKNITDRQVATVEKVHARLESVINQPNPNAKDIFVLNREFHFSIFKISNMRHLINIIATLWDNLAFYKLIYGRKYATDRDSAIDMLKEHQQYIDKLKNHESEEFRVLIRDSLHKRVMELKDKVNYELENS